MARFRARTDANQQQVIDDMRYWGCKVQSLAAVGEGVPDLLVGYGGDLFVVEVKDPTKPPSKRKLTKPQEKWHKEWGGYPVLVVTGLGSFLGQANEWRKAACRR